MRPPLPSAATMNGTSNHPPDSAPSGSQHHEQHTGRDRRDLSRVVEALEAVHGSQSSNETRKQASIFLEEAKAHNEAPDHGFTLASDRAQAPVLRHFGLSMLEHAIRHRWVDYTAEQSMAVKDMVVNLARDLQESDPLYLRNKIAQLWVEVAKRSWAGLWMDMDELLVNIWSGGQVPHKIFVAAVLEGLSEDVFNREDATATLRGSKLSKACVDIFTPTAVLLDQFPNRSTTVKVRCGDEGWLVRLANYLFQWTEDAAQNPAQDSICPNKVLVAMRAALAWAVPRAVVEARSVQSVCRCLAMPNVPMQMVSLHTLPALSRP